MEPRLRVERARPHIAVPHLPSSRLLAFFERHSCRAGQRHAIRRALTAVETQPFAAVRLHEDLPDAVAKFLRCMRRHASGGLENMSVRVDDAFHTSLLAGAGDRGWQIHTSL